MTAKRVDSNQLEVVKAFRGAGASVWITSDMGKGGVDIVVGWETQAGQKLNFMVEIKDGKKPPSQRRLTPEEERFHDNWKGQICIIYSADDVVALLTRAG